MGLKSAIWLLSLASLTAPYVWAKFSDIESESPTKVTGTIIMIYAGESIDEKTQVKIAKKRGSSGGNQIVDYCRDHLKDSRKEPYVIQKLRQAMASGEVVELSLRPSSGNCFSAVDIAPEQTAEI